jgi:Cu/Ag efflux protein CusF
MFRTVVCTLAALVIWAGLALADEVKGKIKKVDADKGTISVMVDGKAQTFTVPPTAKFYTAKDTALKGGIKDKQLKPGAMVTITCETKDGKEVVTQIKLGAKKQPK